MSCRPRHLVRRRAGAIDAHEFAERYRDFLPKVLNFIRLRVPDEAVAQDLTASTFEHAFRKIGQLRQEEAFAGWLFRIARNEVGQYYRRRRPETSLDGLLELPARGASPFEAAAQQEQLSSVLAALAALSERERDIIALKFVAGLSNREIANAMHLSDSNVGVILFRAIRRVREHLGEAVEEEQS